MCGPALAYAQDVLDELARRPADLILSSEMLMGVMVAAEVDGVPLALLCPNISLFPLPGLPPIGMGLRPAINDAERTQQAEIAAGFGVLLNEGLPPVNAARTALGLRPVHDLAEQVATARRILLATSPAFDFTADFLPPPFRYVGPLLADPAWAPQQLPMFSRVSGDPLILVSFSSTFQDQVGAIRNVARAMAGLPVRGLVTLGPALAGSVIDVPVNVTVLDAVSHEAVLPETAVVVTHAGHGTIIRALAHGVPLLCLPMGRDQHDNAARVAVHGAGLVLDRTASAEVIRESLQSLLHDPAFRGAAQRLSAAITSGAGTVDLASEVATIAIGPGWRPRETLLIGTAAVR